jgi:hypothetical protein
MPVEKGRGRGVTVHCWQQTRGVGTAEAIARRGRGRGREGGCEGGRECRWLVGV